MVTFGFNIGLVGIRSRSYFDDVAVAIFTQLILSLSSFVSRSNQILLISATDRSSSHSRRRLDLHGGARGLLQLNASDSEEQGILVSCTVQVDVFEVSALTGKNYDISGQAADDTWSSGNLTMMIAAELASDFTSELNATLIPDSNGESLWNKQAAVLVSSATGSGGASSASLSLAALPKSASYDPSSILIDACKWYEPCHSSVPSQVPTHAPTSKQSYKHRRSSQVHSASSTFLVIAFMQIAFTVSVAYKCAKNRSSALAKHTENALQQEIDK
jgi:hypothetical protein